MGLNKAKAGELGNRTKRRLKEFNKVLKTGTSTQYDKGLKAGRDGVIKEIGSIIKNLKNYNWSYKEIELWWEDFKKDD